MFSTNGRANKIDTLASSEFSAQRISNPNLLSQAFRRLLILVVEGRAAALKMIILILTTGIY